MVIGTSEIILSNNYAIICLHIPPASIPSYSENSYVKILYNGFNDVTSDII